MRKIPMLIFIAITLFISATSAQNDDINTTEPELTTSSIKDIDGQVTDEDDKDDSMNPDDEDDSSTPDDEDDSSTPDDEDDSLTPDDEDDSLTPDDKDDSSTSDDEDDSSAPDNEDDSPTQKFDAPLQNDLSQDISVPSPNDDVSSEEGDATSEEDTTENAQPINLTYFYDANNDNSRKFFVDTLYPLWQSLQDRITFELKPIAKSINNTDGAWTFECFNEDNCTNNLYHACVLNSDATDVNKFAFVECSLEPENTSNLECSEKNEIPIDEVENCTNTDLGVTYLYNLTQDALNLTQSVEDEPKVFINNELVETADVEEAICKISPMLLPNCGETMDTIIE